MNNTKQSVSEVKTEWGIRSFNYNTNNLWAVSRPTTQEDNFGGITNRWDLYAIPYHKNNGVLSEITEGKAASIGRMVKYYENVGGNFAIFINNVRIEVMNSEIVFLEKF